MDETIIIDGLLDESVWNRAPDASVFIQSHPDRDDPHKIQTTAKILYDETSLYISFLCYDSEPEKIIVGSIGKDIDLRATDSIYVLIDTVLDKNNYFYFALSVLGVKTDSQISKDGRTANYNWNGIWTSAIQKTDFGWTAELSIERSNFLNESEEIKRIGLSLSRVVPRLDSLFHSDQLDPAFNLDELKEIKELTLLSASEQRKAERRVEFTPYIMAGLESKKNGNLKAGVDIQFAFSRILSGHLAINPDYSTVEPDNERINLSPFELYFPEKRNFFMDGSNSNQQKFGLFYSKRIGDIYGGVKLNRKFGASEFSFLSSQTKEGQYLDEESANFSVLSLKNIKIFKSLSIGFTAANKLQGKENRGNAGIEVELDFTDRFKLLGQFALSYGDFKKNNEAFFVGPSYDSPTFHMHLFYKQIGKHFGDNANYVGFVPDDNRREFDAAINKTFLFKKGSFNQLRYISNYNLYLGMDGSLRSWQIDEGLFVDLRKSKFTLSILHTMEFKLNEYLLEPKIVQIPGKSELVKLYYKSFRNDRTQISSEFNNGEWKQFRLSASVGKNYGSPFQLFTISKKFELFKNFFSEYDFSYIFYTEENLHRSTSIHLLKFTFYANENLFWKLFFQTNKERGKTNFQVMCIYKFKPPFGTIQLTYQEGQTLFEVRGPRNPTLILEIGYMF
ncbi:DUF5916 domain-containing protein [Acidobacteriota bacterium]